MVRLQEVADSCSLRLCLTVLPGSFPHPARPALWVSHDASHPHKYFDPSLPCDALAVSITRNFDQDPRFGLAVLAGIAQRALSPAVNDPGTAIDILGRTVRLLAPWAQRREAALEFSRIWVPPLAGFRCLRGRVFADCPRRCRGVCGADPSSEIAAGAGVNRRVGVRSPGNGPLCAGDGAVPIPHVAIGT